mgnify:CR=1 FL=1
MLHKSGMLIGIIDKITQPLLMINGKKDHLAPIGNIYYMLENGPVTGKEVRIYPDAGHWHLNTLMIGPRLHSNG